MPKDIPCNSGLNPPDDGNLSGAVVKEAYLALQVMARISNRSQAEVCAALHRAGLIFSAVSRATLVRRLVADELVENVVELCDGGIIVTVLSERERVEASLWARGDGKRGRRA